MHVAMISYHTCPLAILGGKDTGGMNVYVRELTRQLGLMGVHVDVFTRSQDEHVPHVLHDLGYGNRVVHVRAGPEIPLVRTELESHLPEFIAGIEEFSEVKALRYELIHSHYWFSGLAAGRLQELWNVPVVHMFHTLGLMKRRVSQSREEVEGDYRIIGERKVLEIASRIIAATQAELAQLQWLYNADPTKIKIIPPGVDPSHFYPIPDDEAKEFIGVPPCNRMLLYVGRIEPLKGIDNLIQAITQMDREGMQVCLVVIGGESGQDSENENKEILYLKELTSKAGIPDLVTFLGRKSQDTLPYYYSAAEVVVMPSHYESFGMVALEAMACGTPVVASQVGGLAFLIQDGVTGFTVPVDEPKLLANRLSQLIIDTELRERMGRQAAEFARGYSWDKIADQVLRVYEDVLKGGDDGSKNYG